MAGRCGKIVSCIELGSASHRASSGCKLTNTQLGVRYVPDRLRLNVFGRDCCHRVSSVDSTSRNGISMREGGTWIEPVRVVLGGVSGGETKATLNLPSSSYLSGKWLRLRCRALAEQNGQAGH